MFLKQQPRQGGDRHGVRMWGDRTQAGLQPPGFDEDDDDVQILDVLEASAGDGTLEMRCYG